MKTKTIYTCQECGYQESKWTGKCTSCDAWNSFAENIIETSARKHTKIKAKESAKLLYTDQEEKRMQTNISELDRVLGGGIVDSNLILLTGEPGIGKSTLTMQICGELAKNKRVLYVSGEESVNQLASRAKRLNIQSENISILTDTIIESIVTTIGNEKPQFVILDSIQVVASPDITSLAGSVSQVRYCTEKLMEIAKIKNIPVIIIGHVTKEGNLAGPKLLEHLVDTVLYIEGDRYQNLRMLRATKNRFGSTNEVGVFEMGEKGLVEVDNPSKIFLKGRQENSIGSVLTSTIEGSRPFIIETQALVSKTAFGYPKRTANGFELLRTQQLIAVLQKYAGINLLDQDVYVNVAGGFRLKDPSCDLAMLMAIASSFTKRPLPSDMLILGEVGLSGELRPIAQLERRLKEAEKLGIKKALVAGTDGKFKTEMEVFKAKNVKEALSNFAS
jgi:DNA repair protein RadA/Sms